MESIIDILSSGRDREAQASKINGFVVGIVTNNQDPDKLGRVKVKFPWLSDEVESWWARVAQPMAGGGRGQWWIPEIDDEVLVAFEQGDVRFPYVVGSLYNGVDTPPSAGASGRDFNEDGANDLRFIRSRSGHLLIFDDKGGDERITLQDNTGQHALEISAKDKKVSITSQDGDIELIAAKQILLRCETLVTESSDSSSMSAGSTFSVTSGGDMSHASGANMTRNASSAIDETAGSSTTLVAGTGMTIQSGTSTQISAGTDLKLIATTSCEMGGLTVKINAQTTGEMSALTLTMSAMAMAELKAGAMVTISGAMVKLN